MPDLDGVTVYEPFGMLLKLYAPVPFAVAVPPTGPVKVTVVPEPEDAGEMVPEIVNVPPVAWTAVKLAPVALAPLMVTVRLVGLNTKPDFEGVRV